MVRKVEVLSYNQKWPSLYEEEAKKLRAVLGENMISVYHIGSTSVPGLSAKNIIDIMPVVADIQVVDTYLQEMRNHGYEPKGENGIPGRRYFQKGGKHRSHHIHIYPCGHIAIDRHLAFRDYLRTHSEAAHIYSQLTEQLAGQYPYDITSYVQGKEQLVLEIERQALEWYRGQPLKST